MELSCAILVGWEDPKVAMTIEYHVGWNSIIMYFSNRFGVFPTCFFRSSISKQDGEQFPGHFIASSGSLSSVGVDLLICWHWVEPH